MKSTCLLFFALLISTVSATSAASQIRTAAQESSEPKFVAVTRNGKPAIGGICVDIMRAIERIDPSIQFVGDQSWQPRARIEAGVKAGTIDAVCGLLRTNDRNAIYDFVDTPLFTVNYLLTVRADDAVQIANWDDVRRLGDDGIVLAIQSFGIVDVLQGVGGLKIDASANSSNLNLKKLLAGRGRFYCHRSPGIMTEIRKAGLQDKVKLLPKVMATEKFYMTLSKTILPADAKKLNAAIALLERTGELVKMYDRYQDADAPAPPRN